MGIIQVTTDTTGQINVNPRRVKIISSDNLSTVTTAGYLNKVSLQGYTILSTDVIDMWYGYVSKNNPGTYSVFIPTITNGVITIEEDISEGNVLLPVLDGDFAIFNGTTGEIRDDGFSPTDDTKTKVVMLDATPTIANNFANFSSTNGTIADAGYSPSNGAFSNVAMIDSGSSGTVANGVIAVFTDSNGSIAANSSVTAVHNNNIQTGSNGIVGTFISFSSTPASGSFNLSATPNSGNFAIFITNRPMGQVTVISISDPGVPSAYLNTSLVDSSLTPVVPIIIRNVSIASTVLNASSGTGQVFVINPGILGSSFFIRDIKFCLSAGFSGGDRNLRLTDGVTNFNGAGISSALLITPINTLWGETGNPITGPTGTTFNSNSQTSAGLWFQYTGGTTNYADGGFVEAIVTLQRIL